LGLQTQLQDLQDRYQALDQNTQNMEEGHREEINNLQDQHMSLQAQYHILEELHDTLKADHAALNASLQVEQNRFIHQSGSLNELHVQLKELKIDQEILTNDQSNNSRESVAILEGRLSELNDLINKLRLESQSLTTKLERSEELQIKLESEISAQSLQIQNLIAELEPSTELNTNLQARIDELSLNEQKIAPLQARLAQFEGLGPSYSELQAKVSELTHELDQAHQSLMHLQQSSGDNGNHLETNLTF
jgi:chromosome segregation ATPase